MTYLFHVYELWDDTNEVYLYVGKGNNKRNRLKYHIQQAERLRLGLKVKNRILAGYIRGIIDQGRTIDFRVIFETTNEQQAFAVEKQLIERYGRRIDGTGTLANLTLGGEGTTGHTMSDEAKYKMGVSSKSRIDTEATRKKKQTAAMGRKHDDATKEKIRVAGRGRIVSLETRKKMSNSLSGRKLSDKARQNISKSKTGMLNPRFGKSKPLRDKHRAAIKKSWIKRRICLESKFAPK